MYLSGSTLPVAAVVAQARACARCGKPIDPSGIPLAVGDYHPSCAEAEFDIGGDSRDPDPYDLKRDRIERACWDEERQRDRAEGLGAF